MSSKDLQVSYYWRILLTALIVTKKPTSLPLL